MPNNRAGQGTAFVRAAVKDGAAVYRTTPKPTGTVTTRPADGATAANDIWQEVYTDGADTTSYVFVAKSGQVLGTNVGQTVNA